MAAQQAAARQRAQQAQQAAGSRWALATAASPASSPSSAAQQRQRSTMQRCSAAGAACPGRSSSRGGAAAAAAAAGCVQSPASHATQTARACRWGPMSSSKSLTTGELFYARKERLRVITLLTMLWGASSPEPRGLLGFLGLAPAQTAPSTLRTPCPPCSVAVFDEQLAQAAGGYESEVGSACCIAGMCCCLGSVLTHTCRTSPTARKLAVPSHSSRRAASLRLSAMHGMVLPASTGGHGAAQRDFHGPQDHLRQQGLWMG